MSEWEVLGAMPATETRLAALLFHVAVILP